MTTMLVTHKCTFLKQLMRELEMTVESALIQFGGSGSWFVGLSTRWLWFDDLSVILSTHWLCDNFLHLKAQ